MASFDLNRIKYSLKGAINMDLKSKVFKVMSTRVWRTYFGGKEIEKWQGIENPSDGELPEEWIASTVMARNPGREHIDKEGLSRVFIEGNENATLKDIIASDPIGFLGEEHYNKYGSSMAFLAKIIDSLNRLTIQVHPTKEFARNFLKSEYGKTEAWYILGGRKVDGEDPYVLLGFKPGITREKWKQLFEAQDIQGMFNALHKVYIKPGELFFIPGGLPHAIGSGCFLIEIQEPTDYTMRVERTTPEGRQITDFLCHQGVGFDKMLDCFNYEGYTKEQVLEKLSILPQQIAKNENSSEDILIGPSQTELFSMNRLSIGENYDNYVGNSFCTAIVYSGKGRIEYVNESIEIKQGDFLFIPAGVDRVKWINDEADNMEIIECFPPK